MNRFRTLAVTCIAAATLAFEIILVRVFAIEHFHHFAYMAIGIAMLGFGTSGTVLALIRPRDDRTAARWFWWASVAVTLALILSPALVHQVPLDATQLAWDYRQWLRLGLVYVLLALPFGRIARRMIKEDPTEVTPEMRQQVRDINKKVMGPQLRMIAA